MNIKRSLIAIIVLLIIILAILYSSKSISFSPLKQKTPIDKYLNTLGKEAGYTKGSLSEEVSKIANGDIAT